MTSSSRFAIHRRLPLGLLAFFLCLGLAAGASAQEPSVQAPASFLIETISVEGASRESVREIVASESRLRPGETYTEQELREAVYRVRRLPFVLDAEFSLRKGSERGAYELIITVEPTRPLFFSLDGRGVFLRHDDRNAFTDSSGFEAEALGTVGARYFVGSSGLAFASVDLTEEHGRAVEAGYTQYNLFGPGSFASFGFFTRLDNPGLGDDDEMQGALTVGIPLTGSHSLRSTLTLARFESEYGFDTGQGEALNRSRFDSCGLDVVWIYDTTDDPVFPTSGVKVEGGAGYGIVDSESRTSGPFPFFAELTSRQTSLSFAAERHWSLTPRQAISLELDSGYQRDDPEGEIYMESDFWSNQASFTHSSSLWGAEKTDRIGDLRLENEVAVYYYRQDAGVFAYSSDTALALSSSVVFRNRWGLLRAGLTFIQEEDGL